MKTIYQRNRLLLLLLPSIFLFSGCSVYKKTPDRELEQIIQDEHRVKIYTQENGFFKFKKIIKEDNQYYGIKMKDGMIQKIPLNPESIQKIKIKDKTLSTVLNVLAVLSLIVLIPAVVFAAGGGI